MADSTHPGNSDDVENSAIARKDRKRLQAEQRKRLQPLRKRVTQAEAKLEALQRTRAELDRQLADPKIYNDQNKRKLQECLLEKSDMDKQCCAVENEWILASEELDDLSADLPKS